MKYILITCMVLISGQCFSSDATGPALMHKVFGDWADPEMSAELKEQIQKGGFALLDKEEGQQTPALNGENVTVRQEGDYCVMDLSKLSGEEFERTVKLLK